MEREVIIVRREGDYALVKPSAGGGCGRCAEVGGCSSGLLNQVFSARCALLRVANTLDAPVGARVRMSSPPGLVWRAVLLVYLAPLALGLLGAMAAAGAGEGAAVLGLVAGLAAGVLVARFFGRGLRAAPLMQAISNPVDSAREHTP